MINKQHLQKIASRQLFKQADDYYNGQTFGGAIADDLNVFKNVKRGWNAAGDYMVKNPMTSALTLGAAPLIAGVGETAKNAFDNVGNWFADKIGGWWDPKLPMKRQIARNDKARELSQPYDPNDPNDPNNPANIKKRRDELASMETYNKTFVDPKTGQGGSQATRDAFRKYNEQLMNDKSLSAQERTQRASNFAEYLKNNEQFINDADKKHNQDRLSGLSGDFMNKYMRDKYGVQMPGQTAGGNRGTQGTQGSRTYTADDFNPYDKRKQGQSSFFDRVLGKGLVGISRIIDNNNQETFNPSTTPRRHTTMAYDILRERSRRNNQRPFNPIAMGGPQLFEVGRGLPGGGFLDDLLVRWGNKPSSGRNPANPPLWLANPDYNTRRRPNPVVVPEQPGAYQPIEAPAPTPESERLNKFRRDWTTFDGNRVQEQLGREDQEYARNGGQIPSSHIRRVTPNTINKMRRFGY